MKQAGTAVKQAGKARERAMPKAMPKGRAGSVAGAADPVTQFFAALDQQGHLATFEGASARVRLDVVDGKKAERWLISITRGDVAVTHSGGPADATVRIDRPHLEALITGRMNAQAAFLRNLFACEGSVGALMMFQRCLPGPPGSTGRVKPLSSKAVMAQRGMK